MKRKLLDIRTLTPIVALLFSITFTSCERLVQSQRNKLRNQAADAAKTGDFQEALAFYESSLDGSPDSADTHFQMAIICESKTNDPLAALFHFRRCARLDPKGPHATEAEKSYERLEPAVVASLSNSGSMSKADAVKLKNQNAELRKQITDLKAIVEANKAREKAERAATKNRPKQAGKPISTAPDPDLLRKLGGKTYVVQPGDTLAKIARKVYKSEARWSDIEDANRNNIENPKNLQPGQVLIIPE
ncbi:MAG TPA: LysM peptidoglycan-binding domain-containing protein [Chthoniobacterales bacterium]